MTVEVRATELQIGDQIVDWSQKPFVVGAVRDEGGGFVSVVIDTQTNGRHRVRIHASRDFEVVR